MYNQEIVWNFPAYLPQWDPYCWQINPNNPYYLMMLNNTGQGNLFRRRTDFPDPQDNIKLNQIVKDEPVLERRDNGVNLQQNLSKKKKIILSRKQLLEKGYQKQKSAWSEQEDLQLCRLVESQKLSWKEIEESMPNRTYKMCYSRYRRIKMETKNAWTKAEEQKIRQLVLQYGKKWKKVSHHLPGRSAKQIRQRYINFIRPNINNQSWTVDQDLILLELVNEFGKKWKKIQEVLGNRSQNQIKNRFFSRILKLWNEKKSQLRILS